MMLILKVGFIRLTFCVGAHTIENVNNFMKYSKNKFKLFEPFYFIYYYYFTVNFFFFIKTELSLFCTHNIT